MYNGAKAINRFDLDSTVMNDRGLAAVFIFRGLRSSFFKVSGANDRKQNAAARLRAQLSAMLTRADPMRPPTLRASSPVSVSTKDILCMALDCRNDPGSKRSAT
eukprot:CAMPEP_0170195296 /NCGR_PEP_ID=MMETSP0040_2-20121228/61207_1 /TAXON_ID=641309 /ORGANISM="Lotharella oceanica, Strain CCMP622" /LENGTH=103 /DNA_ID=CAMNT_0010444425 /DNA_START=816 /DNA_END=1127 /DNA_ORIENTATION=+